MVIPRRQQSWSKWTRSVHLQFTITNPDAIDGRRNRIIAAVPQPAPRPRPSASTAPVIRIRAPGRKFNIERAIAGQSDRTWRHR